MAQQSAVKTAANAVPGAKKMGRPPGSRNQKPREFDYLTPKKTFQKPEDFYAYLAGYPDKTGIMAYVFRVKPKIDHSMVGITDASLYKSQKPEELTEEYVAENYGRGLYMVKLHDANRPRGQMEACRTWFNCEDAEKPPQYDPRTLCLNPDAKNQDEITRQINAGVFIRDAQGLVRLRTDADGPAPPPAASAHSGGPAEFFPPNMMPQLFLGLLQEKMKDSHTSVKDTIEVAQLLNSRAAPAIDVEALVARVVERLGGTRGAGNSLDDDLAAYERVERLMNRFRPAEASPANGIAGTVADVAAAATSGGGFDWARMLGPALAALVPVVIRKLDAFPLPGSPAPHVAGAPPAQNVPPQPMTLMDRIAEVAGLGLEKMQTGLDGFTFAAYVCNYHPDGLQVFQFLDQNGGPAGTLGLIGMNPATAPMLNDPHLRAQIEKFLADFFTFDPSVGPSEEGSTEPAAPPVPPVVNGSAAGVSR